jgi:cell division protein FtsB
MAGTSRTPPTVWSVAWSVGVSLAFWLCLLAAAACFAAVALAPKVIQHQRLHAQYAANQHHLAAVERQTLQLSQVVAALREDSSFVEELARVEFDAVRAGEEVIPVAPALQLDARTRPLHPAPVKSAAPVWQPMLVLLATHQQLRSALLWSAAVLVILAFAWLQEPSATTVRAAPVVPPPARPSWWQRLRARYTAG